MNTTTTINNVPQNEITRLGEEIGLGNIHVNIRTYGCCDFIQQRDVRKINIYAPVKDAKFHKQLLFIKRMFNNIFGKGSVRLIRMNEIQLVTDKKYKLASNTSYLKRAFTSDVHKFISYLKDCNVDVSNHLKFKPIKNLNEFVKNENIPYMIYRQHAYYTNGTVQYYNDGSMNPELKKIAKTKNAIFAKSISFTNMYKIELDASSGMKIQLMYQFFRMVTNRENDYLRGVASLLNEIPINKVKPGFRDFIKIVSSSYYMQIHKYYRIGDGYISDYKVFIPSKKELFIEKIEDLNYRDNDDTLGGILKMFSNPNTKTPENYTEIFK